MARGPTTLELVMERMLNANILRESFGILGCSYGVFCIVVVG